MKISTKHFTTSENAQNIVIVGNENETLFSDAANLFLDKNSKRKTNSLLSIRLHNQPTTRIYNSFPNCL